MKKLLRLISRYKIYLVSIFVFSLSVCAFILWYFKPYSVQAAGWYDDSLLYRTPVTVDNTGSADASKRILVDVNTSTLISSGKMQSDCGDSRFTDASGNILQYYIDAAGGACNTSGTDYWVLLPDAIPAEPITIYHYYGNDLLANGTQSTQFAQSALAGYTATIGTEEKTQRPVAYWKFDEGVDNTCPGGTNDACDHTSARHDLVNSGAIWQTADLCKNGQCLKFDGTNDFLSIADDEELDFDATESFTLSGWFKRGPISAGTEVIISKISTGSPAGVGSTATTTITTSTDEGTGGDDASWRNRVFYDANNNRWHTLYIDSSSDIINRSTSATSGVTFDGSGTVVAGTYDYDDFSCSTETDGSTTYLHCAYSTSTDHILNYKRCELTGSAPYITCGSAQAVYTSADSVDDVSYPSIVTDSNDCVLIAANVEDDSIVTAADEHNIYLWKENDGTCGDGTMAAITPLFTAVQSDVGYNNDTPTGLTSFGDLDAQVYWVDTDTTGTFQLQTRFFDGDTNSLGASQIDLDTDIEGSTTFLNFQSIGIGNTNITFGMDDGTTDLDAYIIRTKDGSSVTQVDTGLNTSATAGITGGVAAVVDTVASGANDIWVFAVNNTDAADIYYANSIDGGTTWNSAIQIVDSYDTNEVKYLSAYFNSENCDITLSWLGNASTPWNVNTKIVNTGSCSSTETSGYKIQMESDGDVSFIVKDGTNTDIAQTTTATYDDNVWHHYSAVRNGSSNIKLYIDGVEAASDNSLSTTATLANTGTLYLGIDYNGASNPFKGFLDDTKIYRYARSSSQAKIDTLLKGSPLGNNVSFSNTTDSLQKDLVGYWKFDESAADTCTGGANDSCDSSGNHNDGAWNGNATSAQGKFGNGVSFDGSGDYISITESSVWDFDTNSSYTVAFWFKTSATADSSNYLTKGLGSAYPFKFEAVSSDRIQFAISDGTNNPGVSTSGSVEDNTWHHVIGIRNVETDDITMYLDGVIVGSANDTTTSSIANNLNLFFATRNAGTSNFFTGTLDEIRIYNRALSSTDISNLYHFSGFQTGYWNFDEGRGGSIYNRGTVGQTASFTNGPVWTTGKISKAISFDGTNDYVTTSTAANNFITAGESTLTAWILPAGTAPVVSAAYDGSRIVGDVGTDQTCNGCFFGLYRANISGTDNIWAYNWDGNEDRVGVSYTTNEWAHFTWVHTGGNLLIYKNGILAGTAASSDTTNLTNFLVFGGGVDSNKSFNGKIDEVKTYNYALTQAQIIENMNVGHPIGGSPVGSQAAYWKLDDGYGTTARDTSINKNNATLVNMASPATSNSGWSNDGKFGKAISFDGTNDYVSATSTIDPANTDFTISMWLYPKSTDSDTGVDRVIFSQQDGTGTGRSVLYFDAATGHIKSFLGNSARDSGYTVSLNTWMHVALVHDNAANKLYWYINGTLQNINNNVSPESATGSYIFGDHKTLASGNYFGLMDEIKMYHAILTSDQILTEFNRGKAAVFGAASTASDGTTADHSAAREYCVPGDTSTCNPPTGEWLFNENNGTSFANDTSVNGKTAAMNGAMLNSNWIPGKYGSALSFDGNNDSLLVANNYNSASTTMSLWFKVHSFSATQMLINKYFSSSEAWGIRIDSSGNIQIRDDIDSAATSLYSTAISLNTWYHVAAVIGSDDSNLLYLNGVLVGVGTSSTDNLASFTGNLYIAQRGNDTNFVNGVIDEVRIYDYVRTPAQIAWEYNRGAPSAWYKFDECQGTTAYNSAQTADGAAAGTDGTITIGSVGTNTTIGTCSSSGAWFAGATAKYGSTIDLDGSDDYVAMSASNLINTGATTSISVAAWIKADTMTDSYPLIKFNAATPSGAGDYYFFLGSGYWSARTSGGTGVVNSISPASTGTWTHLAMVWVSDSTLQFYVNGVLQGTDTTPGTTSTATQPLWIGRWNTTYFNGQLDDLRIYQYPLTAAQVRTIYNNGAVSFR